MKRTVSTILTTSLFVLVGVAVLNTLLYGKDPVLKKIGINIGDRMENELGDAVYPSQKIVAKSDVIEVRCGRTILKTDTTYALGGLVYAYAKTGEELPVEYIGVHGETNGREVAIDRNGNLIRFTTEGIYILTLRIDTEYYNVKLPVTKIKKA